MNGLLTSPTQQPGQAMPAAAPTAAEPMAGAEDTGPEANVSPEEQQQYEHFVANGMKMIFDERSIPALLHRIQANNPVEGLAEATITVVGALEASAEKQGVKISGDVLMQGGIELMENIAELAKRAKVHDFSPEEVEQATYIALDKYGTMKLENGSLDKDAVAADFRAMMEADKAGKIEELLPGISAKAEQIRARGPAAPGEDEAVEA